MKYLPTILLAFILLIVATMCKNAFDALLHESSINEDLRHQFAKLESMNATLQRDLNAAQENEQKAFKLDGLLDRAPNRFPNPIPPEPELIKPEPELPRPQPEPRLELPRPELKPEPPKPEPESPPEPEIKLRPIIGLGHEIGEPRTNPVELYNAIQRFVELASNYVMLADCKLIASQSGWTVLIKGEALLSCVSDKEFIDAMKDLHPAEPERFESSKEFKSALQRMKTWWRHHYTSKLVLDKDNLWNFERVPKDNSLTICVGIVL
jgi:hypothetical protein